MSATSSLIPGTGRPAPTAIEINTRASEGFDAKLAETVALLREAAQLGPATQASSLGAEDMVITHLINAHALPISIFVLETGALHAETLALLDQLQAQQATHPHAPLTIYRPQADAVIRFVTREGADAMVRSIELRKACCGIRKMEPLGRALAGQKAWLTGLRREQSGARAEVPLMPMASSPVSWMRQSRTVTWRLRDTCTPSRSTWCTWQPSMVSRACVRCWPCSKAWLPVPQMVMRAWPTNPQPNRKSVV